MRKSLIAMTIATSLLATSRYAQATPLPPGTPFPGVVVSPGTETTAPIASTSGMWASSGGGPATFGTYIEQVYSNAGLLDFAFQFTNDASSASLVVTFNAVGYAGYTTDVNQTPALVPPAKNLFGTGAFAATAADRTTDGNNVEFNFLTSPSPVPPGGTSFVLIIQTNATAFVNTGTINFLDGFGATVKGTNTQPIFAPAPTPEPASLLLLCGLSVGMGGFGFRRWRKGQAADCR